VTRAARAAGADRTLRAVLRLLARGPSEARVAACVVLRELRPETAAVVRALRRAWETAPPSVGPYVLDALAAQRTPEVAQLLTDLLAVEGWRRDQAQLLLRDFGPAAAAPLCAALDRTPPERATPFLVALARSGGAAAADRVCAALESLPFGLAKSLCRALRAARPRLKPDARRAWCAAFAAFAARPTVRARPTVATAAAKLLRAYPSSAGALALLPLLAASEPDAVRRNAAAALHASPVVKAARPVVVAAARAARSDPTASQALRAVLDRVLRRLDV
jgi:hypothetical protein